MWNVVRRKLFTSRGQRRRKKEGNGNDRKETDMGRGREWEGRRRYVVPIRAIVA